MFLVMKRTLIFCWLLLYFESAAGQLGVAFASGRGIRDITPYRLAIVWNFGPFWCHQHWALNTIWETSFSVWDGPHQDDLTPDRVTDLTAFTTGPMFRWQRKEPYGGQLMPYLELGVGLSWLSKTEIEGRILSLHFQFEDKFGIGFRFGHRQQYDLAIRAYHYSNASIKRPNSGVNLAMVGLGIWL